MREPGQPPHQASRFRAAWRVLRTPGPHEPSSLTDRIAARQSALLLVAIGLALGYMLRRRLGEDILADSALLQHGAKVALAVVIALLWAALVRRLLVVLEGTAPPPGPLDVGSVGWRGVLVAPDIVADDVRAVLRALATLVGFARPPG